MSTPALSILDLVPVRTGQTSAEAVSASLALAERADALGFRRYWFAEHHNMPAVASTAPPVLIAAATARTDRIRVGSGGVMLPNHAPLIVAEQFAALEAIAPGRIDLGIGRAPGSDPVITQLLRQSGTAGDVERFPSHVQDIALMLRHDGASVRFTSGGEYAVRATPAATGTPQIWLLGSSDYSAQLAASLGLPYVFANHFAGNGLRRALDLYRSAFQPSDWLNVPQTFLTANVVAAATAEEAEARALPQLRAMARIRSGRPLTPLETVEQAQQGVQDADEVGDPAQLAAAGTGWFVGEAATVRASLAAFATEHEVDEIMISPVAGSFAAEPLDAAPGRAQKRCATEFTCPTASAPRSSWRMPRLLASGSGAAAHPIWSGRSEPSAPPRRRRPFGRWCGATHCGCGLRTAASGGRRCDYGACRLRAAGRRTNRSRSPFLVVPRLPVGRVCAAAVSTPRGRPRGALEAY